MVWRCEGIHRPCLAFGEWIFQNRNINAKRIANRMKAPVAVLLATGAFAAFLAAQTASASGTVEGTVTNSVTGAGIDGASVALAGNKSGRYETTSDAGGHFRITGVAPGTYRPDVKKDGFASPTFDLNALLSSPGLRVGSDSDPV